MPTRRDGRTAKAVEMVTCVVRGVRADHPGLRGLVTEDYLESVFAAVNALAGRRVSLELSGADCSNVALCLAAAPILLAEVRALRAAA
jgi:hypothetical protein